MSKLSSKGQVTLFVILSVILVISIVLFFIFRPSISPNSNLISNPEGYLEKCTLDSIQEIEDVILSNNGYSNNNFSNFITYASEKVPYMCTTNEFYVACVPQDPGFFSRIQLIIENKVAFDVTNCFADLKRSLEEKGYSVSEENLKLNITISDKVITARINKKFIAEKDGSAITLSDLEFLKNSVLYSLLKTMQSIINYESALCEFNLINWIKSIPNPSITRDRTSYQTKIYTITDRYTKDSIKFAIKTCVLPAGI